MHLSIIIVSYNTKKLLKACLLSLHQFEDLNSMEIIVVDNASTDGSPEMIKKSFPLVKLITNQQNLGFSKANNQGSKVASGQYLVLLNSDTLLTSPALSQLLALTAQAKVDIATCRLLNPDDSIQPQGGALPTFSNLFAWMLFIDDLPFLNQFIARYQQRDPNYFLSDHSMGWVGGTVMMIKSKIYHQLQGLDEHIFMYGEDVEFCYRAHQQGLSTQYFSQPHIIHLGQKSGSEGNAIVGEFTGLIYLFTKHRRLFSTIILRLLLILGALLRILVFGIIRTDEEKFRSYHQALEVAGS
jgi:hypothetical protein